MHQSIPAAPSTPPPPPQDYCRAFARLVSPWGGAFANFVLPGGRAFANPGSISELLTRTQFPIRIYLHRRFYWKKCRLAHLSRTGINIEEGCKGMLSILCIHFFIAYQARITYRKPELSMWINVFWLLNQISVDIIWRTSFHIYITIQHI